MADASLITRRLRLTPWRPLRRKAGAEAELILDGGVRRGTDVLKALAMGAKTVSFARPYLYGLAAGGYEGG